MKMHFSDVLLQGDSALNRVPFSKSPILGNLSAPKFFFVKIILAILVPCFSHINFRISLLIAAENKTKLLSFPLRLC